MGAVYQLQCPVVPPVKQPVGRLVSGRGLVSDHALALVLALEYE